MKYSAEKKTEALARMIEIGVQKTSEEMSISAQTLYKWRNEVKEAAVNGGRSDADTGSLLRVIENEKLHTAAMQRLEGENAKLRSENAKLRQENSRLKVAVKAFIG